MKVYREKSWEGEILSEYFSEDFTSFTVNTFNGLPIDLRRELRDTLREKGVYVRQGSNVKIAESLYQAVHDDLQWPKDESEKAYETGPSSNSANATNLVRSVQIRHALNDTDIKNISNLVRTYNRDEKKYSGRPDDNFERKLAIFKERCNQTELSHSRLLAVFSIMLTG